RMRAARSRWSPPTTTRARAVASKGATQSSAWSLWRLRIEEDLHLFQASNEPNHPHADPRDDRKAVHVGESVSLLPYLSAKQCDRTPLCFINASGILAYPPGEQP